MAIREQAPPSSVGTTDAFDIRSYRDSWLLHLEAEGGQRGRPASQSTLRNYARTLDQFASYLRATGMPTNIETITREHVESFVVHMIRSYPQGSPTPRTYYYHLRSYFRFLKDVEEEIKKDPMEKIPRPKKAERVRAIADDSTIAAILKTCSSRRFIDVRDEALIRLMIDAGPRLHEVAQLSKDVDVSSRRARVLGKGLRERDLVFGVKTARSLARYVRQRSAHPFAYRDELWLGLRGPMTDSGIYQALTRRAAHADVRVTPHQIRHTWAHICKADGMSDEELMALGGWRTTQMVRYYGRSAVADRAAASHARIGPGDRF